MIYFEENIGVFKLKGKDSLDFLQRISTNDFRKIRNADLLRTLLLNEKGKIVDFITLIKNNDDILLITSNGNEFKVKDFFEKYLVSDDVEFTLEYKNKFTMIPELERDYEYLSGCNYIEGNYHCFDDYRFKKIIILEENKDSDLLNLMKEKSEQLTYEEFKNFAIEKMYLFDSYELNDEINPLECGLKDYISFNKGCYIGQEVIARLDSQGKLPKVMVKIDAEFEIKTGDKIYFWAAGKETECGFITSASKRNNEFKAIGFIRDIYLDETNNFYINKNINSSIIINKFKYQTND